MFSATAIMRAPAHLPELPRRLRHRNGGHRDQHDGDHQQLEHQELAGQAADSYESRVTTTTNTSFAFLSVTRVTVRVQYC